LQYLHRPVLVYEVVHWLVNNSDGIYVDGTVGTGGHSLAIAKRLSDKGRLIGLDRDPDAVKASEKRLAFAGKRVRLFKGSYVDLDKLLAESECQVVDGILLDLGISSHQLEKSGRGFSFSRDEPLDMRMDPDDKLTAGDLINKASPRDLVKILKAYGEEKQAKPIVRAIVTARRKRSIQTSSQLADLICSVIPPSHRARVRHPATRTFQALRIAVNRELQNLEIFLNKAPSLVARGGRLVILSYHSLEDRLVKQAFLSWERGCNCPPEFPNCVCGKAPAFRRLFKKGIKPSQGEIAENPRARSALLRAAERVSP
jgi:16S rRNA (cytosine1402-N4)-methyltransferase